jgi:hypothetical protein
VLAVCLASRFGDVALISGSRLLGVALMLALPFLPVYPLAAALSMARMVSAMMAMPVRQSYTMGIVEPEARGSAAGISGVARRLSASLSPSLSGYWIGIGDLELPFVASAAFLLANAALYYAWFRKVRPLDAPDVPTLPPLSQLDGPVPPNSGALGSGSTAPLRPCFGKLLVERLDISRVAFAPGPRLKGRGNRRGLRLLC